MTAVAVPSPDLLRRLVGPVVAILLTALAVAFATAPPAHAAAYCVTPAKSDDCIGKYKTLDEAFAAADKNPGDDEVIRRDGTKTTSTPGRRGGTPPRGPKPPPTPARAEKPPVPPEPLPKPEGPSVFDDITNFML